MLKIGYWMSQYIIIFPLYFPVKQAHNDRNSGEIVGTADQHAAAQSDATIF